VTGGGENGVMRGFMICTGRWALKQELRDGRSDALLRNSVEVWFGKEVKRQLGRPRCWWVDVIN
jgi:hypothetical protein